MITEQSQSIIAFTSALATFGQSSNSPWYFSWQGSLATVFRMVVFTIIPDKPKLHIH